MQYKNFDEIRTIAELHEVGPPAMTREQRLERWAELLEREPTRRLRSLGEIESKTPNERRAMRAPDSPLSVAFEDPVLRAAGLAGDRLADAMDFFVLSDEDAHRLLCSCMNGWTMTSSKVARGVRAIAGTDYRAVRVAWMAALGLIGAPVFLYLIG